MQQIPCRFHRRVEFCGSFIRYASTGRKRQIFRKKTTKKRKEHSGFGLYNKEPMDDVYSDADYSELIRQIQQGDPEGLDHLADLVEGRLRAYIYRLTLDRDLSQDLLQETLLHMVESVNHLERPEALWPWLYRTALGKVQHHFRDKGRQTEATRLLLARAAHPSSCAPMDGIDGLSAMVRKELLEAVFEAIGKLNLRQRGVLVLRCFEQRSYAEIATIMDCSEMAAQVLLFRAKRSLRRHLSHRGFKTGLVSVGLGMFARRTASAGAISVTGAVSRATLEVGVLAKTIAVIGTQLGIGIGVALMAVVLVVAGWSAARQKDSHLPQPSAVAGPDVASFSAALQYPSRVLAAYDPDGSGWQGIEAGQVVPIPVDPNAWLCGAPPSEQSSVVLPAGRWVELGFSGRMIDAPGDDVFVVEWGANGERARVLVSDGQGNTRVLGEVTTAHSGLQVPTESGFDLADIQVPFVPRAVRIVSTGGGGGTSGFDLHSVRARVRVGQEEN